MPSPPLQGVGPDTSHNGQALQIHKRTGARCCCLPCIPPNCVCSTSTAISLLQGVGLCHGIAGSGYALLSHGRATGDKRQLRRAARFALFAADHWRELYAVPDAPASLFEVILAFYSHRVMRLRS